MNYLRNLLLREKRNRGEQKMKNNTFTDSLFIVYYNIYIAIS
ncbi:hypothetical protein KL86DYS2_12827 [uncultured Dysgonomonas sp.]|uniref:Uncharacterized protein n=1 Tax=uncultured Dysgonomonas sp. TaxID=206096 RepID=A0A212K1Z8_9BACT|nr:hypothetical protein KL86DYS2_12827 [uncultured Dysgonomonas sp.]